MTALLDARDLHVAYPTSDGRRVVLDGVSLTIEPGEAVALVGPSGSGKTTLGLTLLGLAGWQGAQAAGRIRWRGDVVTRRELAALRGREIGYVPQEPRSALNPYRRCARQLATAVPRQQRRERLGTLLAEVGLEPRHAREYPHRLSGGMCQRVLLAGALATEPSLLIADEPTASLDAITRARALELLATLTARRNLALLLITHDRRAAAQLCDRTLLVHEGRLTAGAPAVALCH